MEKILNLINHLKHEQACFQAKRFIDLDEIKVEIGKFMDHEIFPIDWDDANDNSIASIKRHQIKPEFHKYGSVALTRVQMAANDCDFAVFEESDTLDWQLRMFAIQFAKQNGWIDDLKTKWTDESILTAVIEYSDMYRDQVNHLIFAITNIMKPENDMKSVSEFYNKIDLT